MTQHFQGPVLRVADWLAVLGADAATRPPSLPDDWQTVVSTRDAAVYARPLPGREMRPPADGPVALVHGRWLGRTLPLVPPDFDADAASLDELGELRAGPLAACVVDPAERRLHVRRDAGGAATLFEAGPGGARLFCTKLAPLRGAGAGADPDPVSLLMFLEHLVFPAPHTPWTGIRQFLPGEARSYDLRSGESLGQSQMLRVNPRLSEPGRFGDGLRGDAAVDELDRALRAEMAAALDGEPHPALLLSSGKDSTSLLLTTPTDRRRDLLCITAAPRVETSTGKDESILARRLAEELGHPIQVETFDDAMLERVLREELPVLEVPTGDAATAAMLAVVPKLDRPVSSMITGDGGDALFGFPVSDTERRLLALSRLPLVPALCRVLGNRGRVKGRSLIRAVGRGRARFFMGWDGALLGPGPRRLDEAWRESLAVLDRRSLEAEKAGVMQGVWFAAGHFARARYPAEAAGVPVAFPWVGPLLSQAVYRLAPAELTRGKVRKAVLVDWLDRHAPAYIAKNPKARFSVYIDDLVMRFERDLAGWHAALSRTLLAQAGVPVAVLRAILDPWLRTRDPAYARPVYGLVLLETWLARQSR